MTHPYSTIEFASSLGHIGEPLYVPEWGTAIIRRRWGEHYDAIGTYPITVSKPDCDLSAGLDRLADLGLVSVVLVTDDVWRPDIAAMERAFDFVRPFKLHYLHDRAASPRAYSRNHRDKIRRAGRLVSVGRFELATRLDEWDALYRGLVTRRNLDNTMHAFPRDHHAALARLPGVAAIGAFAGGRLVSAHIWVCHGEHAMSHLVASNEQGYESRASYAVNSASIDLLTGCRLLNFGGAAGESDEGDGGLARFKRGFANATASSYLCGKVLDDDAYAELSRQAGMSAETDYFPAYRRPSLSKKDGLPVLA